MITNKDHSSFRPDFRTRPNDKISTQTQITYNKDFDLYLLANIHTQLDEVLHDTDLNITRFNFSSSGWSFNITNDDEYIRFDQAAFQDLFNDVQSITADNNMVVVILKNTNPFLLQMIWDINKEIQYDYIGYYRFNYLNDSMFLVTYRG